MEKPRIPVITKLDLPDARARFDELAPEMPGLRGISAATGEGVRELLFLAWEIVKSLPPPTLAVPEAATIDLAPSEPFEVRVEEGVFVVSGERIERLAQMTDFDSDEALMRFEQVLARLGVEKRLRELGVADGDTVRVAGFEFTYS
jgi:GTP-binding protein